MDNLQQLAQIVKYQKQLQRRSSHEVDFNTAAFMWVKQFAQQWRSAHSLEQK